MIFQPYGKGGRGCFSVAGIDGWSNVSRDFDICKRSGPKLPIIFFDTNGYREF